MAIACLVGIERKEKLGLRLDKVISTYGEKVYLLDKKIKKELDLETIVELRLAHKNDLVKVLGRGKLESAIKVTAHKFSASAIAAIEAAGGEAVTV